MVGSAGPQTQRGEFLWTERLSAAASSTWNLVRQPAVIFVLCLLALALLSVRAWSPLLEPGYVSGQEGPVPPTLQYEMDRCFDDRQLPCRWAAEPGQGYGVPVFDYYGPLPYYIGEPIHLAGLGFFETVDVLYVMAFLMAGIFMFLLARELWGNLGGLVAAAFYIYAPWQASLLYVQGSLAHQWALAFFPAILWSSYKVTMDGKPAHVLLLSLFTFGLLTSHNLVTAMFLPLALVWVLALLVATKKWQRLIHLGIAGIGALSLAAFFTLPALFEQDLVHLEKTEGGYYIYSQHFPRLRQLLLSRFWGYGPSVIGDADGMSFQIGWLHWGIALATMVLVPFFWRRSRVGFWAALSCLAVFLASVFLMTSHSDSIWRNFSLLQRQLFPFRFLGLAILTSAFLAGALVWFVKGRPYLRVFLALALIAAVIGLNQEFFRAGPREYGDFSGPVWATGPLTDVWELTQPKAATVLPLEPAPAKVQVLSGDAEISGIEQESSRLIFLAQSKAGAQLQTSVSDFPNWRVRVDGQVVPHGHTNDFAAITLEVPPGSHQVELRLEDTRLRTFANYWSLAAWLLWLTAACALAARAVWPLVSRRFKASD